MTYHYTDDAACRSNAGRQVMDDAIDYPRSGWAIPAAKSLCAHCPVRNPCLEDNIDLRWGVVGNTDETQRARIRRHIRREQIGGFDPPQGDEVDLPSEAHQT